MTQNAFNFPIQLNAKIQPDLSSLVATAVSTLKELLTTNPIAVAWSGGKDSTATLILCLLAMLDLRKENRNPANPLYIMHGDTGIENPAVSNLARKQMERLLTWAKQQSYDIRIQINEPKLSDSFAVNILSGGQLPTYPSSRHRVCSAKFKIEPAKLGMKRIAELLSTELTSIVTVLGTRFEESAIRETNMNRRGDNAATPKLHDGRLLLAPICNWSSLDVWELLGTAGTEANIYPVWQANFDDITEIYRDSSSGECPVVAYETRKAAGCGARTGCHACCAVGTDRSLQAMTEDLRYAHLKPLLKIRDYLASIPNDWNKRNWVTRQIKTYNGDRYVKIQADHFNSETLLNLVGAYLHADLAECKRAAAFDRAIRLDQAPNDPFVTHCLSQKTDVPDEYLQTMRNIQFQVFDDRKLIAADFYSAVLRKHPRPYQLIELAYKILNEGYQPTPLAIDNVANTKAPPPRWIKLQKNSAHNSGLGEPLLAAISEQTCFEQDEIHDPGVTSYVARQSRYFDVDEEAASLFFHHLYPDHLRSRHHSKEEDPQSSIHEYLSAGIVSLSAQGRSRLHAICKTRQSISQAGLYEMSIEQLLALSVPDFQDGEINEQIELF